MKHKLDWSPYRDAGMGDAYADIPKQGGDYAKAIAACINSGQCETLSKQVMCPSYKVSENKQWSTGGRVKLLKSALNSEDWQTALADPVLAQAMDLCVSCKGCKRECDNNIDMALIKAEYQAWKAENQGLSKRSKLFAETPKLLHRYPWLGKLIRWRNQSRLLRRLSDRWLGLSEQVPLPEPTTKTLDLIDSTSASQGTEVVLFIDTFGRHFEPAIAEDAHKLLTALGYRVLIANPVATDSQADRPLCCGRTYLAQGLVEQAREEASRLVAALEPHVSAGRTVIGLEASCVLGLRDDALALGLPTESIKKVAENTVLLEEFLAKEIMAKRLTLNEPVNAPSTLIHGHCHQKAVGAVKAVRRVLKQFKGLEFSIIESGCCGMAGTFGLETEHQVVAAEMAGQGLLPSIKAEPEATVVANGFSCRQQIRNLSEQRPVHLSSYLCKVLGIE